MEALDTISLMALAVLPPIPLRTLESDLPRLSLALTWSKAGTKKPEPGHTAEPRSRHRVQLG